MLNRTSINFFFLSLAACLKDLCLNSVTLRDAQIRTSAQGAFCWGHNTAYSRKGSREGWRDEPKFILSSTASCQHLYVVYQGPEISTCICR